MYPKFLQVVKCERKRSAVHQLEQNRSSTVRMRRRKTLRDGRDLMAPYETNMDAQQ